VKRTVFKEYKESSKIPSKIKERRKKI